KHRPKSKINRIQTDRIISFCSEINECGQRKNEGIKEKAVGPERLVKCQCPAGCGEYGQSSGEIKDLFLQKYRPVYMDQMFFCQFLHMMHYRETIVVLPDKIR